MYNYNTSGGKITLAEKRIYFIIDITINYYYCYLLLHNLVISFCVSYIPTHSVLQFELVSVV